MKAGSHKPSIDWDRIRAEYEVGGPENSIRSIAARHGVSHTAVNKRVRAEMWPEPGDLDAEISKRVSAKVSSVVSTGNHKKRAEAIEAEADRRAAVVAAHKREWEEIETLRQEAFEARESVEAAFGKAKLLKIMTEATAIKQSAQRKAWGLDPKNGQPTDPGQITVFRIAPLE